jgi:rare lipoprotein A
MKVVAARLPVVRSGVLALALALLSACATAPLPGAEARLRVPAPSAASAPAPDPEPQTFQARHRLSSPSYGVLEQAPATRIAPWREQGRASWYGRQFHGNSTASGEPYDMYALTAAHPTLPMPSYARVTNLANGLSVVVRINDRGPFHKSRIIDLSYAAAYRLGYASDGSAEVEVEQILGDEAALASATRPPVPTRGRGKSRKAPVAVATLTPPMSSAGDSGIFLQLGAFTSRDRAERFSATVHREARALADRIELLAEGEHFRLHAGPYDSVDEARAAADRIGEKLKLRPQLIVR